MDIKNVFQDEKAVKTLHKIFCREPLNDYAMLSLMSGIIMNKKARDLSL